VSDLLVSAEARVAVAGQSVGYKSATDTSVRSTRARPIEQKAWYGLVCLGVISLLLCSLFVVVFLLGFKVGESLEM
jgi:hypothetical protein